MVWTQNSAKPTLGVWGRAPKERINLITVFFFQKKKQKALVLLRRMVWAQISAKPTLGVWGRAPKEETNLIIFFFFQKKKQKALVLLRRRLTWDCRVNVGVLVAEGLVCPNGVPMVGFQYRRGG
jgi:hypothetical protein